jgi:hypothetical protein
MEAVSSSDTLVIYRISQDHIPDDSNVLFLDVTSTETETFASLSMDVKEVLSMA